MTNRSPAWMAAAAVIFTSFQFLLLATLLPRPAAANGLASPPAKVVAVAGAADPLVARGEYLARVAGCHDCHTAGYAETAGDVPARQWLTGTPVGYRGPWGVSYPTNLRLSVRDFTEAQWLVYARSPRLPPMPWFALRDMSDQDLRALYRFLTAMGPAGERAPAPLAPGAKVDTPYVQMTPQNLPVAQR